MNRYHISNDGQIIEYEVVHRPRVKRCIHLELAEHGALQVVAPPRMSKRLIQSTMQAWANYVVRFLAEARAQQRDIPMLHYVTGERHLFMGKRYPLKIRDSAGKRASVEWVNGRIQILAPEGNRDAIRSALTLWYRQEARQHFAARMAAIGQAATWTRRKKPVLKLRLMKRTWGCCSVGGIITLNPHLIKAPAECIDYVVAHEICHLREHNHGRAFYALQDRLYPDWREVKDQLQRQAHVYLHV